MVLGPENMALWPENMALCWDCMYWMWDVLRQHFLQMNQVARAMRTIAPAAHPTMIQISVLLDAVLVTVRVLDWALP